MSVFMLFCACREGTFDRRALLVGFMSFGPSHCDDPFVVARIDIHWPEFTSITEETQIGEPHDDRLDGCSNGLPVGRARDDELS